MKDPNCRDTQFNPRIVQRDFVVTYHTLTCREKARFQIPIMLHTISTIIHRTIAPNCSDTQISPRIVQRENHTTLVQIDTKDPNCRQTQFSPELCRETMYRTFDLAVRQSEIVDTAQQSWYDRQHQYHIILLTQPKILQ